MILLTSLFPSWHSPGWPPSKLPLAYVFVLVWCGCSEPCKRSRRPTNPALHTLPETKTCTQHTTQFSSVVVLPPSDAATKHNDRRGCVFQHNYVLYNQAVLPFGLVKLLDGLTDIKSRPMPSSYAATCATCNINHNTLSPFCEKQGTFSLWLYVHLCVGTLSKLNSTMCNGHCTILGIDDHQHSVMIVPA